MTTQDGYDWPTPHPVVPTMPARPPWIDLRALEKLTPNEEADLWRQHFDARYNGDEQAAETLKLQAEYAGSARINRRLLRDCL